MAKVSDLIVRIGADIKDFDKKFGTLQSKLQTIGKGMTNVGKKMTAGLTAPIVGLGTASVMTYASFEKSMNKVGAISGATGKDFKKLEGQAKKLGATTVFSASEAAEGMSFLAMSGMEVDEIMSAMPGMLDLAAASQMDLATTADIATNIMSGFGLEADQAGRVADVLAKASTSANTDVYGLGEAMKYVAPVANSVGLSMEETAAAVGLMANAGIQGSQAGTALRAGISRLINPVGEAKTAMDELGFSAVDSNGNMKSLEQILAELEDKTKHMTDAQRAQTMSMLFGQEASSGWTAMLEQGSGTLGEFTDELFNSKGTAKDLADTMNSGLSGAFTQLMSALEGLAISFGEILAPVVEKVINIITDAVLWLLDLDSKFKNIIIVVAAVVAAIGPLLVGGGAMLQIFSKLMPVLTGLAKNFVAVAAPIAVKIALIGALIAVIVHLWNTSETFREVVITVFNAVRDVIMQVVEAISGFVMDIWGQLVTWWSENNESIREAADNVWNMISTVISTVMDVIWAIMQALWPVIKSLVIDTWNSIKGAIQGAIDVITGIIQFFSAMFTGDWSGMWDAIKKTVSGAVKLVWNLIQLWFVGKILKAGKSLFSGLKGIVTNIWSTVKSLFTSGVNAARNTVKSGFNFIKNIITTIMNGVKSVLSNIWNGIRNIISTVLGGIRGRVSNIWNSIKNTISTVVNAIRNTIRTIFNSLRGIVSGAFNKVKSAVGNGIKGALNKVKEMFGKFKDAGKNIVSSIADGIKGAIGKVTGAIEGVVSKVRDFLPFSPAKEGPLDDIHRLNFEGPIGDSITKAIPGIQAKLNALLSIPEMNLSPLDLEGNKQPQEVTITVDQLEERPIYLVTPNGKVLAEYVADDVHENGDRKNRRKKRRPKR